MIEINAFIGMPPQSRQLACSKRLPLGPSPAIGPRIAPLLAARLRHMNLAADTERFS